MQTERQPSHRHEWSLTALVVMETIDLFVVAPLAAKTNVPFVVEFGLAAAIVGVVLLVVWRSHAAVAAIVVATIVELLATGYRAARPSERTETLDFAAALVFLVAVTVVLGIAVFGPGRITVHRILGAIAIYLNIALHSRWRIGCSVRWFPAPSPTAPPLLLTI